MASRGLVIQAQETSCEFLERVRTVWRDDTSLALVNRITHFYEKHRYDKHALTADDIRSLQEAYEQLRKGKTRQRP